MRGALPAVPYQFDVFPLAGGLDQHTPQLSLKPGFVRDAVNFECSINGGYTRIPGYERFDGRPSPSAAVALPLTCNITGALAVGDAVTGGTSGATAVVAAIDASTVVLTKVVGTFVVAEVLFVGGTPRATITADGVIVTDLAVSAGFTLAAQAIYRADIGAVPGTGPVRGLFTFEGEVFALRDTGASCLLYKATASGWSLVAYKREVAFTAGGGTPPAEGATITQGAVSAVVRRVVVQSGDFATANAAGRFIIDAPSGGSFTAGALTAGGTATLSGADTAIAQLAGGRYEVKQGDAGNGLRMFGADGVNRGFEFDGATFVPIVTGNTDDRPLHVHVHQKHVFFSFEQSVQHSGTGKAHDWTAIAGAVELLLKYPATGFISLPGDATSPALAMLTDNSVTVLYGSDATTWRPVDMLEDGGAKAYSAQNLGVTLMFDDRGVNSLRATASFGNFQGSSLTTRLRSFLQQRRTLVTDSLVNFEKNQYRLFFTDGYALYCTIVNGKLIGAMPMQFANPVAVACAGESANGVEVSYFGSTNGYVYRLDVGTSFDGTTIAAYFALAFAAQGNAQVRKRYRRVMFELQGEGYAVFNAGYEVSWGEEVQAAAEVAVPVDPVYWDEFVWDEFIFDGRSIAPGYLRLEGTAENIALRVEQDSALWPAYTINSITLAYTPRRIQR